MKYFFFLLINLVFSTSLLQAENLPKVLNIYGWFNYIPETIIKQFEEETGIQINYDVYDSEEILEAKLLAGKSGYDIIMPSLSPYFLRLKEAKVLAKLDFNLLTNIKNLDPKFLKILEKSSLDPQYGVPYLWGTSGYGYNVTKIKEHLKGYKPLGWELLFKPEIASRLAPCGIILMDSAYEVLRPALLYLGLPATSSTLPDLKAAIEVVEKIKPYVLSFSTGRAAAALANGEVCVAQGWNGDILKAKSQAKDIEIEYVVPKEGAELWCDMLAIPHDAPHKDHAHAFINFLMRPKVSAEITNTLQYANANQASKPFIKPEILENSLIYPSDEIQKRLFVAVLPNPLFERQRTRAWARMRAGRPSHILTEPQA